MGDLRHRLGLLGSLVLAVLLSVIPRYWDVRIDSIPPLIPPAAPSPLDKMQVVEDTIPKNATLVATLVDYDVPAVIANEVADLVKPVFNLRKLRSGNSFRLEKQI